MRVTFLGAGDAFGSGGQNHSGYLVEAGEQAFLLDCGPPALSGLKKAGFDSARVDFVAISHLHGDHFGGLPFFLLEYQYEKPRTRPFLVAGPPGTEKRVQAVHRAMYKDLADQPLPFPLNFQELTPNEPQAVAGVEVFPFRVPHQRKDISLALRVTAGSKTVLYSGDTGWTEDLVRYSQGVDLFICECCFFDTQVDFHLSYPQIAKQRNRMGCKRLILSHLGREVLGRAKDLTLETAYDGMVVEV
ncbi:MAG: MBL fold metallo-hydrolase [Deltaproteobacteria bacterium]|nr:MBL fold metallo-hydrolase [Deltaproteobacteria bacterium]